MAEKYGVEFTGRDRFKEAVCIDAMRVYDSCSDKDCLSDIRVYVPLEQQQLVDCAKDCRIKSVEVLTVYTDLQELPFHKGYYTVDMTFFLDVCIELFGGRGTQVVPIRGLCVFSKKCVLYGSEGGVKTFYSDADISDMCGTKAAPRVSVQVAEPVALSAKICEQCRIPHGDCDCDFERLPANVSERFGTFDMQPHGGKAIYATIGLFIIIQLTRNVQMLIPAYDFCMPTKECACNSDNPCELFSAIDFPTDEFFPPKANSENDIGCGCNPCC